MSFHARRFDRAAGTYGAHSGPQTRMAGKLLSLLDAGEVGGAAAIPAAGEAAIVEMGCGTGHLTRRLRSRFPQGNLYVTDAAPRMLAAARGALAELPPGGGTTAFALFDAAGRAAPPQAVSAGAPFALAASNALVQWFPDLGAHFRLVAGLLKRGGLYAVSGFRAENFPELNAILREPPFAYASFPGHGKPEAEAAANAAGLRLLSWDEESLAAAFASPRAFLDAIRGLGSARRPEAGQALTRAKLAHLERTYRERYPAGDAGVAATWRPWYALLQKP